MADGDNDPNEPTPPPAADPKWDDQTREYITQLRGENAKRRTENKTLQGQLAKLSDADKQIIALKRTNALLKVGGGDADMIEYFLRKENHWDDLTGDDLADTLKDRVDDLLARRPELKGQRSTTTRRSGTDTSTGGHGNGPSTQILSREQVRQMRPEAVEEALRRGDLDQMLGRR